MIIKTFDIMLEARAISENSNCLRRKIGVIIPAGEDQVIGYNFSAIQCKECNRPTCPAVHAEVRAISILNTHYKIYADKLYIWAEIPCKQCLSYIALHSKIRTIHCLSTDSYSKEYPIISDRKEEILARRTFARSLGIETNELDREEIIDYELYKSTEVNDQPD